MVKLEGIVEGLPESLCEAPKHVVVKPLRQQDPRELDIDLLTLRANGCLAFATPGNSDTRVFIIYVRVEGHDTAYVIFFRAEISVAQAELMKDVFYASTAMFARGYVTGNWK